MMRSGDMGVHRQKYYRVEESIKNIEDLKKQTKNLIDKDTSSLRLPKISKDIKRSLAYLKLLQNKELAYPNYHSFSEEKEERRRKRDRDQRAQNANLIKYRKQNRGEKQKDIFVLENSSSFQMKAKAQKFKAKFNTLSPENISQYSDENQYLQARKVSLKAKQSLERIRKTESYPAKQIIHDLSVQKKKMERILNSESYHSSLEQLGKKNIISSIEDGLVSGRRKQTTVLPSLEENRAKSSIKKIKYIIETSVISVDRKSEIIFGRKGKKVRNKIKLKGRKSHEGIESQNRYSPWLNHKQNEEDDSLIKVCQECRN